MKYVKKTMAVVLSAGLSAGMLTGCYAKVKPEDYSKTVIATYGDKEIMMDEVNYYLKLMQNNYDSYYSYYSMIYGYNSMKDFYGSDPSGSGKTIWDSLKENAMATVYQTYVLEDRADDYNVSLTDEDKKKVNDTVKYFFDEGNKGLVKSLYITEESLTDVLMRNALAVKVHDYLVKDIDTNVNEADFRFAQVSYLKVAKAPAKTAESSSAASADEKETTAAKEVNLKEAAEKVMAEWKEEAAKGKEGDSSKVSADKIIEKYKDSEIALTYTGNSNFGKPEEPKEGETQKEDLQFYCWNKLKTGDYAVFEENSNVYVLFCETDDDAESKEEAIESELESRRDKMFTEKYPDVLKDCPEWEVKSRLYAQVKYAEIPYEKTTTAAAESSDAETTAEATTVAE